MLSSKIFQIRLERVEMFRQLSKLVRGDFTSFVLKSGLSQIFVLDGSDACPSTTHRQPIMSPANNASLLRSWASTELISILINIWVISFLHIINLSLHNKNLKELKYFIYTCIYIYALQLNTCQRTYCKQKIRLSLLSFFGEYIKRQKCYKCSSRWGVPRCKWDIME